MPVTEERVAYLEGKVEGHDGAMSEVRTDVRERRGEFRELRSEMNSQFQEMRGDMNRQFHALDAKINWVIGSLLAIAITAIAAVLTH